MKTNYLILVICCIGFLISCNTFPLSGKTDMGPISDGNVTPSQTDDVSDLSLTPSIESSTEPTNVITITPFPSPSSTPTPVGMTRNSEWEPHIEEINGATMALVPAGCFMMGITEEQIDTMAMLHEELAKTFQRAWFNQEKPAHQVCFDEPFWIDVYEVTNEQFMAFLNDIKNLNEDTAALFDDRSKIGRIQLSGEDWVVDNSHERYPAMSITWYEANAYCQWRDSRLLTEAEWEYAARGPDALIFPWGNDFIAENVIYASDPLWGYTLEDGTVLDVHPEEVGSVPDGVSWVGAYDMSGNAYEWVNDWYDPEYYKTLPNPAYSPVGPGDEWSIWRVLRGGSWEIDSPASLNSIERWIGFPETADIDYGFRCARDDSP